MLPASYWQGVAEACAVKIFTHRSVGGPCRQDAGSTLASDYFSSCAEGFTPFNGMLYFHTEDAVNGRRLWKTDGTDAGTVLVKTLNMTPGMGLNPSVGLATLNGSLYFQTDNGINGMELWKTDGSPTSTQLVKAFCTEKCKE